MCLLDDNDTADGERRHRDCGGGEVRGPADEKAF
jgi:hypothetical protein